MLAMVIVISCIIAILILVATSQVGDIRVWMHNSTSEIKKKLSLHAGRMRMHLNLSKSLSAVSFSNGCLCLLLVLYSVENLKMVAAWFVTPCSLMDRYNIWEKLAVIILRVDSSSMRRWRQQFSPKLLVFMYPLHDITSQVTNVRAHCNENFRYHKHLWIVSVLLI